MVEISPEHQDEVPAAVESGTAGGWAAGVPAADFLAVVRMHTIVGFLADPVHGGNRDYAGWKVAGYPGGGHHLAGYSPAQMPLTYWKTSFGPTIDVTTCSLDDPEAFPPVGHLWTSRRLGWVQLADGLPCFEEGPPEG